MTTQLPKERLESLSIRLNRFIVENEIPMSDELGKIVDDVFQFSDALLAAYEQEPVALTPAAEHRRVIEMLLSVCGAAFELADDSCEQEVEGETCTVVPSDAFQKLSDALDEIENSLPTEDADRPNVFLAWAAMPRAALKSLLHPAPSIPAAVPEEATPDNIQIIASIRPPHGVAFQLDAYECKLAADIWNACRGAMLQSEPDGWIPVSERLPDETQPVIVVSDGGVVQRTVYQFSEGVWRDWYDMHDDVNVEAFTHWQPLPAAPKAV